MNQEKTIKTIFDRRSVRKYTMKKISEQDILKIIKAGMWAPSGLNNQPWRFCIIRDKNLKKPLANLTKYSSVIISSDVCISIHYNHSSAYDRDKDLMSIGACIQNMLLASEAIGLGSVWLGEILKNKNDANRLLNIDVGNELMAIIALGYPAESPSKDRKKPDDLIIKTI